MKGDGVWHWIERGQGSLVCVRICIPVAKGNRGYTKVTGKHAREEVGEWLYHKRALDSHSD